MDNTREKLIEIQNLSGIGEKFEKQLVIQKQFVKKMKLIELIDEALQRKKGTARVVGKKYAEKIADHLIANGVTVQKMANKKRLIEQVEDILAKWEFFYGQRAGRELWAEKLKEIQDKDIENFCRDLSVVRSAIMDAVEVVHGRWSIVGEACVCSVCHNASIATYYYCPNCGAKMDGERSPDV